MRSGGDNEELLNGRCTAGPLGQFLRHRRILGRRARRQTAYQPVLEDWIWHAIPPLVAYGGVTVAAVMLSPHVEGALFAIAASSLLLLFVGIHNAWDTVTYIAVEQVQARDAEKDTPNRTE